MEKCDCYYQHGMKFLCYGTKEMEECSCDGDTSKCNFYPEKRNQKTRTMTEKRLIDASYENAKEVLGVVPYYPDEIWKFAAMAERFPTVDAIPVAEIEAYLQARLDEWNALGDRKYEPANMWGYNFIIACFDDLERRKNAEID